LLNAKTKLKNVAEIILRRRESLLGRETRPFQRSGMVDRNALAEQVQTAKPMLGERVTLRGRTFELRERRCVFPRVIGRHARVSIGRRGHRVENDRSSERNARKRTPQSTMQAMAGARPPLSQGAAEQMLPLRAAVIGSLRD
jgi:hypothetical protein